jgi:hypothetical protein
MSQTIGLMGYVTTIADADVYRKLAVKPNGERYYEWLLVYVDDILCISHDPKATMDAISKVYELGTSVKEPDRYLGANVLRWQCPDGRWVWAMDAKDYVKNAVNIVKELLAQDALVLKKKGSDRPFPKEYRPEVDVSPELNPAMGNRFQQLIGILRWAVEIGRVDILLEVALLSPYLANPRTGHLEAAYQIFSYLAQHLDAPMAFDDLTPVYNMTAFQQTDWSESIYKDATEELPPKMPEPLGLPVIMTCFVDANHAEDQVTRRSQTGFIIYLNNAPVDWFSKKQNTVESSTFGSEFVAMRTAIEKVRALRYKLRMFGIPLEEPTYMLGDNKSVIDSASKVEARLHKKHNAICFHAVREAAAAGWIRVGWEPTESNVADIFTKPIATPQRRKLLRQIFVKGGGRGEEQD